MRPRAGALGAQAVSHTSLPQDSAVSTQQLSRVRSDQCEARSFITYNQPINGFMYEKRVARHLWLCGGLGWRWASSSTLHHTTSHTRAAYKPHLQL